MSVIAPDVAVRIDTELAIREEAECFGRPGQRLFGFRHVPLSGAKVGVLICSSLLAEFRRNYRRESELGRALAAAGFAVQRFHYGGTGNSEGAPESASFEGLVADGIRACERLRERADVAVHAVVGTRLGALVAARIADAISSSAFVAWEPTLDGSEYFKEAFRALTVRDLKEGNPAAFSKGTPSDRLARHGSVDVLGYTVHRRLYEGLTEQRLSVLLPRVAGPVLLVQIGARASTRTGLMALAADVSATGTAVELVSVAAEEAWWLASRDDEGSGDARSMSDIVGLTTRWMNGCLGR